MNTKMKKLNDLFLRLKMKMKKFFDDTTVHGLKQLYYTKKSIWRGIWIIIITIATGLTAYQVGKAVQLYIDQSTITTIKPLENGKVPYPPLSICYFHWSSWVDWNKVIKLNISKPILYFGLSYFDEILSQGEFDLNTSKEGFSKLMMENGWTYLSEFYMAISENYPKYLSPEDNYLKMAFTDKVFYEHDDNLSFCYTINGTMLKSMTNAASLHMKKSMSRKIVFRIEKFPQVSFNSYFNESEYAMYIKNWLKYEYSFPNVVNTEEVITFFNPQGLFPNFASDNVELNPNVEIYRIKIKGSVYKWQKRNGVQCTAGHVSNYADYSCEFICTSQLTSKLCQMIPFETALLAHTDEPMKTCRKNIVFMVPNKSAEVFATQLDEEMSHCQCTKNISKEIMNKMNACLKACDVACEKWNFETSVTFTFDHTFVKDIAKRNYSKIQIEYPLEESIFVISEIESQSWDTFIANVGGLLGIWFGASIVSLVQTIYLCCFSEDDEGDTIITVNNASENHSQVITKC